MDAPKQDIDSRLEIWSAMEIFWLDTDSSTQFNDTAFVCAQSKYSIDELKEIYWNETFPALKFNLWDIAGEWAGFDKQWLKERVLQKHKYGRDLRFIKRKKYEYEWWEKLESQVMLLRSRQG